MMPGRGGAGASPSSHRPALRPHARRAPRAALSREFKCRRRKLQGWQTLGRSPDGHRGKIREAGAQEDAGNTRHPHKPEAEPEGTVVTRRAETSLLIDHGAAVRAGSKEAACAALGPQGERGGKARVVGGHSPPETRTRS